MKLYELAFACYIYSQIADYDKPYDLFLQATKNQPDISIGNHRLALWKWLNSWGCRQFAKDYHELASEEIRAWYEECGNLLPSNAKTFLELSNDDISRVEMAYANLSERIASKQKEESGGEFNKRFGPAGAAKILFALRPKALVPWDEAIRKELKLDGSAYSYTCYLTL